MDQDQRAMRRAAARAFLEALDQLQETLVTPETDSPEVPATPTPARSNDRMGKQTPPTSLESTSEKTSLENNSSGTEKNRSATANVGEPSMPDQPETAAPKPSQSLTTQDTARPTRQERVSDAAPFSLNELEQAIADIEQYMQEHPGL